MNYIKFFYPGKKRVYLAIINSLDSQLGFYSLGLTGFFQSSIVQYRVKEDFKKKVSINFFIRPKHRRY